MAIFIPCRKLPAGSWKTAALIAEQVDVSQHIRFEMRWLHWLAVVVLAIVLAILLLIPDTGSGAFSNPAADAAIAEAVEDVRDMTEAVANETELTSEEREDLQQSLEQALDDLEEPNTSPEEAFAAVSNLEEELRQQANDLRESNQVQQGGVRYRCGNARPGIKRSRW